MENRWAAPEGFTSPPPRVRYRIKGPDGVVVERMTEPSLDTGRQRHFHALHPNDQAFADGIVAIVQSACAYFREADDAYRPLEGVPDIVVTDDEVRARIQRLDHGENTREAERTQQKRYPLSDLPFDQQRALVERIEAHKREWQFEIVGPEEPADSRAA